MPKGRSSGSSSNEDRNAAKTAEVEKTLVGGSSHRSSSGSVANMEDRSYKHARVSIGGGARVQQQQDAATNQLWKYASILWALTLFVLFQVLPLEQVLGPNVMVNLVSVALQIQIKLVS